MNQMLRELGSVNADDAPDAFAHGAMTMFRKLVFFARRPLVRRKARQIELLRVLVQCPGRSSCEHDAPDERSDGKQTLHRGLLPDFQDDERAGLVGNFPQRGWLR